MRLKNLSLIFAAIAVGTGIILGLFFRTDEGPNPAWIQAGAAVSLILITWRYVALTNRTLAEVEKSRLEAIKPIIVLRSRNYYSHVSGFTVAETFLLNVGSGTAVKLEYASSIVEPLNEDISSERNDAHPEVSNCFQGRRKKLNDALNPCFGRFDSKIMIIQQNLNHTGSPALERGKFGVIALYEDIIGRGYCTLYVNREHYFSDIYTSDVDGKKRREIRRVISKLGSTSDIVRIVRDHERDFWPELVRKHTKQVRVSESE